MSVFLFIFTNVAQKNPILFSVEIWIMDAWLSFQDFEEKHFLTTY
jgi:hypothetical protein